MKDQYFGDVNDYRKYGLLRVLEEAGLRLLASWMRTPDDGSTDGRHLSYLDRVEEYRGFDPELFDRLQDAVGAEGQRCLSVIEESGLLGDAVFQSAILEVGEAARRAYFEETARLAKGRDLVFLDPDNGLEVSSVRPNGPKAPKYVFWDEVEMIAGDGGPKGGGRSLLVYQHFPRVDRSRYSLERGQAAMHRTGRSTAYAIRTSHVLFLLLPAPAHLTQCEAAMAVLDERWGGQFIVEALARAPALR